MAESWAQLSIGIIRRLANLVTRKGSKSSPIASLSSVFAFGFRAG